MNCVNGEYDKCLQMKECGKWISRKLVEVPLLPKSEKTLNKEAKKAAAAALMSTGSSKMVDVDAACPEAGENVDDSGVDTDDERGQIFDFP
jgi:predicted aconitase